MQISKPNWFESLKQHIEENDKITVFRHHNPDGDAYGSQWALVSWIRHHYPDKEVYAMGLQNGSLRQLFPPLQDVRNEQVLDSLGIILDTANAPRIDDRRYLDCRYTLKIDHHPHDDDYADESYIDELAPSTSEIVAQWMYWMDPKPLPMYIAQFLYIGMVMDTLHFTISSVNAQTLKVAGYLLESGFDVASLDDKMMLMSKNIFDYITYLRSHCSVDRIGLVYCYVPLDVQEQFHLTTQQAKEEVNAFKRLDVAKVWALLVEEDGLYNVSIRSRNHQVNQVAEKYGGGGHRFACAAHRLSFEQTTQLLDDLKNVLI